MGTEPQGITRGRSKKEIAGERFIRALLLVGFVAVLAVEAWLLWQVWKLWA